MKYFCILLMTFSLFYSAKSYSAAIDGEILKITVENDNFPAMDSFIEQGANLNLRDENGNTALYTALIGNHLKMAKKLIKAGADVNAPSAENGKTPLIIATSRANQIKDEVENIMQQTKKNEITEAFNLNLQKQVKHQMNIARKILLMLINNGADVNQETPLGTPLMNACTNSWNIDIIDILLKEGAQVNQRDRNGRTALFYGELFGGNKISTKLLSVGADIDIKDINGKTYLEVTKEDFE